VRRPVTFALFLLTAGVVTSRAAAAPAAPALGAIRIVEGMRYPLTVAGVQAALDEVGAAGGGEVWVPANANILLGTTPIRIPSFCTLRGQGPYTGAGYTFTSNASTNVPAAILNADTTGAQQCVRIEGINVWGGAPGARIDAGIKLKRVFVGSSIRDCLITKVSGIGVRIEGDNEQSAGQLYLENVTVTNTGAYGYYLNSGLRNIWMKGCTAERPGRNSAALFINGQTTTSAGNVGVQVDGFYTEVEDPGSVGIRIDGASAVEISNYTASVPHGRMRAAVQIRNTNEGSRTLSPSGLTIRNLYAQCDTLVEDQSAGLVYTAGADPRNPYPFLDWYSSPVSQGTTSTNGYRNSGQIVGIQPAKRAPDLVSAATLAPHPEGGSFYVVTGASTVTNITGLPAFLYRITVFSVSGKVRFTDAGNLNLSGDFIGNGTGGADLLGLIWDGTRWNEAFRSLN